MDFYNFVISHLPSSGADAHVVLAWIQAHMNEVLGWLHTLSFEDVLKQILAHVHVH